MSNQLEEDSLQQIKQDFLNSYTQENQFDVVLIKYNHITRKLLDIIYYFRNNINCSIDEYFSNYYSTDLARYLYQMNELEKYILRKKEKLFNIKLRMGYSAHQLLINKIEEIISLKDEELSNMKEFYIVLQEAQSLYQEYQALNKCGLNQYQVYQNNRVKKKKKINNSFKKRI
ncbi:MAG: hypothetical protein Q4G04_02405 [bacterium]|nr:hypothetical protein [bacterium]